MDNRLIEEVRLPKETQESKESQAVDILTLSDGYPQETFVFKSDKRLLSQHQLEKDSLRLNVWDLSSGKLLNTKDLIKPVGPALWLHYLPHGPLLSEIGGELILSPDQDFVFRMAQEQPLHEEFDPINESMGCASSPNEYHILESKTNKDERREDLLVTYKREGDSFKLSSSKPVSGFYFLLGGRPCSPREGVLCFPFSNQIHVWKKNAAGVFHLSTVIAIKDSNSNKQNPYVLTCMKPVSSNEVVCYSFPQSGLRDNLPKLLVKINFENRSIVNLDLTNTEGVTLNWDGAMQLSQHLNLFLVPCYMSILHAVQRSNYYIFDAREMSLQPLLLDKNAEIIHVLSNGDLLTLQDNTTLKRVAVKELKALFALRDKTVTESLEILPKPLIEITSDYLNGDVHYSQNFASFYKQPKFGMLLEKEPIVAIKNEPPRVERTLVTESCQRKRV